MLSNETNMPALSVTASRGFTEWLSSTNGSLAFSTYQGGKIFFLGIKDDGNLWVHERSFPRAMGLAVSDDSQMLLLATQVQLYRFDNILPHGSRDGINDAIFAPHLSWITGDLDIHDVGIGVDGRPVFVNTLFNCLATTSDGHSFRPIWKPPFISRLAAEDRCHLNGMAMDNGVPRYVTCVSRSDVVDGWRDRRLDGGVVLEVSTGDLVTEGLSMPHSPRLHNGRLWLLNSGSGELGWIDQLDGRFTPIAFCPGYARGLTFVGNNAVVGLSRARENRTFQGLSLHESLARNSIDARCGLLVIDLQTGDTIAWVRIEGVIDELFDVIALPGTICPSLVGIKNNDVRRIISIAEAGL